MRIIGLDIEVGDASRLGSKGRCDARQYTASRRGGGGGSVSDRWHAAASATVCARAATGDQRASARVDSVGDFVLTWPQRVGHAKPQLRSRLDGMEGGFGRV